MLLCLCAHLFICALWSPAGKGLTSLLSFVVSTVSLSLSHWYPGSGVVLDCIDSWSLHPYLLRWRQSWKPLFEIILKFGQRCLRYSLSFLEDSALHTSCNINRPIFRPFALRWSYVPRLGPVGGGDRGSGPPEKSQTKGFLSNTGPEPLKKQASTHCLAIIGAPAKCHLNGISLAGR